MRKRKMVRPYVLAEMTKNNIIEQDIKLQRRIAK